MNGLEGRKGLVKIKCAFNAARFCPGLFVLSPCALVLSRKGVAA